VKDVDLHATPHISPVLGGVQIDAGVGPSFDEELAAEIEVLVLLRGPQPGRKSRALMNDFGASP
jgi:hypothetical protein